MKSTGIVRKTDHLGRIVLPKELRTSLDIATKDPLEIFTERNRIILRKFKPKKECVITGETSDDNYVFCDGKVILSEEGIRILLEELE
ncbi:transcriptional pleiotropic regulator of transition state genes [Natronobacillus azotifigens]|uniref:AbrB/MazE/SpoVT family DNA-binding domain-containing protein n=1 Tax=Natronobacillus azotifigens TaxID=472978 RepID=A0A9J6R9W8_9BACI|nr:AbrB/MazE/SpoVT family DNA-binding domain-containing protein [Natronobacillus azotifigens]MCZ0702158.1 AbrB/MazE/SpoVT family DNA-binding domain-containing protein [Natronobacillus azotifigens]